MRSLISALAGLALIGSPIVASAHPNTAVPVVKTAHQGHRHHHHRHVKEAGRHHGRHHTHVAKAR